MKSTQSDENDLHTDMGVEVVRIPRSKSKKRRPQVDTGIPKRAPSYMVLPTLETQDHSVEISLQSVPQSPSTTPRAPKVRHPAGSILQPRTTGDNDVFVQPGLRRKESEGRQEFTVVDGEDQFPPRFRVVGFSPKPCSADQELLSPDIPSQELPIKRLPIPTRTRGAFNTSFNTTLTDENEDAEFSRSRDEYLQLDLEYRPPTSVPESSPPEFFQDDEAGPPTSADNSKSVFDESVDTSTSHQTKTTTRNYLELTQKQFAARKERDKKERLRLQHQEKVSAPPSTPLPWKRPSRRWGNWGYMHAFFVCLAVLLVIGVSTLIVALTQEGGDAVTDTVLQNNNDETIFVPATTAPIPTIDAGFASSTTPPTNQAVTTVSSTTTLQPEENRPLLPEDFPEATRVILTANDPNAPQVRAYQWLLRDPAITEYPFWKQFQRFALATFFFSTNGPQWHHAWNWLDYESEECHWYVSACDSLGHIRRILLQDANLVGTLPVELFLLTSLQQVQLQENPGLVGTLPTEIASLTDLSVLWIHHCGFSATASPALPTEIGRLSYSLLYLDVSGNPLGRRNRTSSQDVGKDYESISFSGDLPSQVGLLTRLKELIVSNADLSGVIPSELGAMQKLEHLEINGNGLFSSLPTELGRLEQLKHFGAFGNHLTGTIPSNLGAWTNLKIFDISNNHVEGTLPLEFGAMASVEEFWAYDNLLSGPVIPPSWGLLSNSLTSLDLSMNSLDFIPDELGHLTQVRGLWIYQNQLRGPIPMSLGNLHKKLLQLSLFGNELSSGIPSQLGRLTKLRGCWLDDNFLTGSIPTVFGMLTNLVALHLFSNQLWGPIPDFHRNPYYAVQEIRLEKNLLTGAVPTSLGYLHSNLELLQLHDNRLTGTLPSEMAELTKLVDLTLNNNEFKGAVPWELCAMKISAEEFLYVAVDCDEVSCDCGCSCPTGSG